MPPGNGGKPCERPAGFPWALCDRRKSDGFVFELKDCDGDGVPDPTCLKVDVNDPVRGQSLDGGAAFGVIESAHGCRDTWQQGACKPSGQLLLIGGSSSQLWAVVDEGSHGEQLWLFDADKDSEDKGVLTGPPVLSRECHVVYVTKYAPHCADPSSWAATLRTLQIVSFLERSLPLLRWPRGARSVRPSQVHRNTRQFKGHRLGLWCGIHRPPESRCESSRIHVVMV